MTQLIFIVDFELLGSFGVFVGLANWCFILIGTFVVPVIVIVRGTGRRVLEGAWIFCGHAESIYDATELVCQRIPTPLPTIHGSQASQAGAVRTEIAARYIREPSNANAAPWGSAAWTIQAPPGTW
jgi:hypothetical protein